MPSNYRTPLPVNVQNTTPIPVFVSGSTPGTPVNEYAEQLVPYNTETTVLSYTVPSGTFSLTSVIGWGDTDGEFFVRVNGTQKGGGRNTASTPICYLPYSTPISANVGDVVTISVQHYNAATKNMKVNLMGDIV